MEKFENNTYVMAERLKALRKKKGLSHAKLSQALREQYEIKISKDALIAYEAPQYHAREGANNGMSVKYLRCLADFYGVSTDYLLGLCETESFSMEVRAVCEYTGLTEKAVNSLKLLYDASKLDTWKGFSYTPISFVSGLLSPAGNPLLRKMVTSFCVACQYLNSPKLSVNERCEARESFDFSTLPLGFTLIEREDYFSYAINETERYFSRIIRAMANRAKRSLREAEKQEETDDEA